MAILAKIVKTKLFDKINRGKIPVPRFQYVTSYWGNIFSYSFVIPKLFVEILKVEKI